MSPSSGRSRSTLAALPYEPYIWSLFQDHPHSSTCWVISDTHYVNSLWNTRDYSIVRIYVISKQISAQPTVNVSLLC